MIATADCPEVLGLPNRLENLLCVFGYLQTSIVLDAGDRMHKSIRLGSHKVVPDLVQNEVWCVDK